ncbi:MAG: hypothetical protein ABIH46_12855 [Chloroflexota bacterium]
MSETVLSWLPLVNLLFNGGILVGLFAAAVKVGRILQRMDNIEEKLRRLESLINGKAGYTRGDKGG